MKKYIFQFTASFLMWIGAVIMSPIVFQGIFTWIASWEFWITSIIFAIAGMLATYSGELDKAT